MAKAAKNTADEQDKAQESIDSKDVLSKFLEENKDDHLNFIKTKSYKISTGSLMWDFYLDGGLRPGLSRFTGPPESGKSSAMLEVVRNFVKEKSRKALYIDSECRLSDDIKRRCGLKFATDAKDWHDGVIFHYKGNVYEGAINLIQQLVNNNEADTTYCFVIDSMDSLILRDDYNKTFEENVKVAGSPALTKRFFQKLGAKLSVMGHLVLIATQYSSNIEIQYTASTDKRPKQGGGGWALAHFANFAFDFSETFGGDIIKENDALPPSVTNPILGKRVKVKFTKSTNEQTQMTITYPIKTKVVGKSSIWRGMELIDFLVMFKQLEGKQWISFKDTSFYSELEKAGAVLPESGKWNGKVKLLAWIDSDEKAKTWLDAKLSDLLSVASGS